MRRKHILSIPEFNAALNDFYYSSLSRHLSRNGELIGRPHAHDFYLCAIFTSGKGSHVIDFQTYTISPGSVFFVRPGQVHSWNFQEPPEGHIFFHSQKFFELIFHKDHLSKFPFYYSYYNSPFIMAEATTLDKLGFYPHQDHP